MDGKDGTKSYSVGLNSITVTEKTSTYNFKEQRKRIKDWAKANIVGKEINIPSKGWNVAITVSGIKESLNQPHKHYYHKNELIKNIEEALINSVYLESKIDSTGDQNNVFHYMKTMVNGEESYFVLRETKKDGMIILYSIVDKIKK